MEDGSLEAVPDPAADVPEVTGSGNSVVFPELTGSGNLAAPPVYVPVLSEEGDFSVTTSGDVYIYPESPEMEALAEDRSVYAADVLGLPNSSSLQYLEDVAGTYPDWYKYMAFKSDANYSQSMALWIAPKASVSGSQNRVTFEDADCIEVRYVRSGTSNYYQYVRTHYDSYQVAFDSDVFLYTNIVDGYARFDIPQGISPALGLVALVLGFIFAVLIARRNRI